ncbi:MULTISPECIES: type IV pilin protein [Francisella]|uniref:type IV pilin protein n=1 Tax=Francisella TaxID=262 RepID=UPI00018554EB|nr:MULTISPECIES: type IV pilin protein [Francisella]AEB27008.1 Type IV pilus biogenesis protein PilE [Francisella cf. novicida Fx1]APA82090.1 Type IV pilus biogenesis protein PilE [Francisella tularensis subsp. novicida PA10-7858]EDZ90346.1 type IV pili fiber building block protein [Francisella tularensis subsp. novicida FTG]MBK2110942.1 type IV pilin protein [Francisella tularensis subsp. novicida FSC159]MBK2334732.1 type IV pilin protein [Francisella tularensis subsp. novicida]
MLDKKGFSLVELMVVIAIIAILASIGIPMYNNYILRNHRTEATSELLSAASAADNYEIRFGSFPSGSNIDSFYHTNTQNSYYSLAYCSGEHQCPNVSYVITATAQGTQTADTPCANIEIEVKGGIVNKTPAECWN